MARFHFVLILSVFLMVACNPTITRNSSSLIDNLDGVWTYPKEQEGDISVTVISGMRYETYDYYDDHGYELSRAGDIMGQEGVYFFPNEASFYSPKFYLETNDEQALIINKFSYNKYIREGRLDVAILLRVSDTLDKSKPPVRTSIEMLGLPYDNPFNEVGLSD